MSSLVVHGLIFINIAYITGVIIGFMWGREVERKRHANHH